MKDYAEPPTEESCYPENNNAVLEDNRRMASLSTFTLECSFHQCGHRFQTSRSLSSSLAQSQKEYVMPKTLKPRVAIVHGFWGQNIGNAFFNIGGRWIAEQVFPGEVAEILDQPGYRTFNRKSRGNPQKDFGLLSKLDVEYLILQGPMLTTTFRTLWEPTFKALASRGTKIILLSAAFFRYTKEEIASVTEFLKEYPPCLISTRDADSYELIRTLSAHTYSGIDSAFFAPKAYTPVRLHTGPFICLNFDQYPEPNLSVRNASEHFGGTFDKSFDFHEKKWYASQPRMLNRLAGAGQWQCYLAALLDFRRLPAEIADFSIVRTDHRFNPHVTWKIYQHENAVASDEPFTYFSLYAGTQLTLSDRVHACVATLAYGNPAMLYHPTPRARLFARVGLDKIREFPCVLDQDYLNQECDAEIAFLKRAISEIGMR